MAPGARIALFASAHSSDRITFLCFASRSHEFLGRIGSQPKIRVLTFGTSGSDPQDRKTGSALRVNRDFHSLDLERSLNRQERLQGEWLDFYKVQLNLV